MGKKRRSSLNRRLVAISATVFIPMLMVMVYLLMSLSNATDAYRDITHNIVYANQYTQDFKSRIDYSMYLAVISWKSVEELGYEEMMVNGFVTVNPYEYIEEMEGACDLMSDRATVSTSRNQIQRVKNTLRSLEKGVRVLEEGINGDWKYEEKMDYFDQNIKNMTTLIREGIQDYIYLETMNYENIRRELDEKTQQSFMLCGVVSVIAIFIAVYMTAKANRSVTVPIRELCDMTEKVAEGDFSVRTKEVESDEIAVLSRSFNDMTKQIGWLVEDIKRQQENLHMTETKLLQAQINPHFLYNTLDAIVWLAEAHKTEEVVHMVTALSSFFRTTLSKGKDFITVQEEKSHIQSYLEIQQFRYQDILDYSIEVGEELYEYMLPKLTLQPLVENALYHGIKNKRGKGMIRIIGEKSGDDMVFKVIDNGKGMTKEELGTLRENIRRERQDNNINSFGLTNVNQRIRHYYGEGYGLEFESRQNEGTEVTVKIKAEINQPFV